MAGPTVTLAFAGDSTSLDKTFANVGASAEKMAGDVGKASKKVKEDADKGFDGIRDGADNTERRIIGFRDALTGTGDIMTGLKNGDMVTLATGFADLASSVANLGADLLEWGKNALTAGANVVRAHGMSVAAKAKDTAATVAHRAATIAAEAATKTMAAAQWVLNAAMSANPIVLVIAGLAALTAAFVLAWQNSETFRSIVTGAFDAVRAFAEGAFNWIRNNWPLLLTILTGPIGLAVAGIVKHWDTIRNGIDVVVGWFRGMPTRIGDVLRGIADTITAPFKAAFNAIARFWNSTVGKLSFKAPGWIPGIGGKGWDVPDIPTLAAGGIATGPTLALIGEGGNDEAVIPLPHNWRTRGMGGQTSLTVVIQGNVYSDIDFERKLQSGLARLRSNGATF